jgi:hypothetical protein
MASENKGLTVKINFFSMPKKQSGFNSTMARLWVKGQVTQTVNGKKRKRIFNDAGQLISILGKWNTENFKRLKKIN